ncbi:hypothetical protein BDC45DRAFT_96181 [Circinella umbellata]|nr:hypothetical protein BDC45DRAFT_96181 [Circinella umbellata]
MNPLAACTSSKRRQKQPIRLPEDDDDTDEEQQHFHRTSCIMPVWPFTQCLGPRHGGRLTLGEDGDNNPSSRILDDYLDPNTTVGIEPLLDQHAQDPNDDDNNDDIITGSGSGGSTFFSGKAAVDPHRFLSRNPFATTNSNTTIEQNERRVMPEQDYFFEEDDAQFLSDHRISAVINDHAKNNVMESDNNTGASANPVSRNKTEEEEEQKKHHYQERELESIDKSSTTERELQDFSNPIVDQDLVDIHSGSSAQQEPRELDDFNTSRPAERELVDIKSSSYSAQTKKLQDFNDSLLVEKELVDISKNTDSKSLLEEPVKELQEFTNNKDAPAEQELTDFGHTNSSRPRQPVPEKKIDKSYNNTTTAVTTMSPLTTSELTDFSNTTIVERETSHQNISNNYNNTAQVSNKSREFHVPPPPEERESGSTQAPLRAMSQPPSPRPKTHDILLESSGGEVDRNKDRDESGAGTSGRRSSVAVVAQSLLGDRLDDFTEKLAFIKKNIIMSLEDEDGYDEEQQQQLQQHQQPIQQQRQSMDLPKRSTSEVVHSWKLLASS